MNLYIASLFDDRIRLRPIRDKLNEMGHKVVSTWLDEADEILANDPQTYADTPYDIAQRDYRQIRECDAIVLDTLNVTPRGGREVELGYAVGIGKLAYLVGPKRNVFHYTLPGWATWAEALEFFRG